MKESGFTLAEILISVAIVAILAGTVFARFDWGLIKKYKSQTTAQQLASDLGLARELAIATCKNHLVKCSGAAPGVSSWRVYRRNGAQLVAVENARTVDAQVTVTGTPAEAEFTPMGSALSAGSYSVSSTGSVWQVSIVMSTGFVSYQEVP